MIFNYISTKGECDKWSVQRGEHMYARMTGQKLPSPLRCNQATQMPPLWTYSEDLGSAGSRSPRLLLDFVRIQENDWGGREEIDTTLVSQLKSQELCDN